MTIERRIAGLYCHEVADRLEGYVAQRLDDATRAAVQAHVKECSHCASFGARYAALIDAVKKSVEPEDAAVTERLRARLADLP